MNYENYREAEKAYPRKGTGEVDREIGKYSFVFTSSCNNLLYNCFGNYYKFDGTICPKCGRMLEVVQPNILE